MKTLHLLISGGVQGVGYRDWMVGQAARLGIAGWVRNHHAGHVEAMVHGDEDAVAALVRACRQGPPHARVTDIAVAEASWSGGQGFGRYPSV